MGPEGILSLEDIAVKALPIGISTFRFLIEDEMVYVDKTGII